MTAVLRVLTLLVALVVAAGAAQAATPPTPDASSYLLVEPATGERLAERAADQAVPMASLTKMMTALLVIESAPPDRVVTVPEAAAGVGGSSAALVPGERIRIEDLLAGIVVASGNDAAVAAAVALGGSEQGFVAMMNARADELGLDDTRFLNPHGLDALGHRSSAADLVALARAAMREPRFRALAGRRRVSVPGPDGAGPREYVSKNELLDVYPAADGVKTGNTDGAGYAVVAHAVRPDLGVQLYAVLIGAPDERTRALDARGLLEWGFSQYARPTLIPADRPIGTAPVAGRPGATLDYRVSAPVRPPIRLGGPPITETVVAPPQVTGPISEGEVVGSLVVRQGERVIARRELVAAESEGAPGLWDRVRYAAGRLIP